MANGKRQLWTASFAHQRGRVLLLFVLILLGMGLKVASPQLVRYYFDLADQGVAARLTVVALFFLCVSGLNQGVSLLISYVSEQVGWTATNRLRGQLLLHALRLDLSFHKDHTSGEMIERIDGDVTAMANFFSHFVIQIGMNLLFVLGVLVVLLVQNWKIGLAFTAFAIVALLTLYLIRKMAMPHWAKARQASAEFYGFLGERLSGTEDVQANGAVPYVMRRFFEMMYRLLLVQRRAFVYGRALWPATIGLLAIGYAIVFVLGHDLYSQQVITAGTFLMMYYYMEQLNGPLLDMAEQIQDFQKAGASIGRVQQLLQVPSRVTDGAREELPREALSVAFEQVTFGYGGEAAVLEDVTFSLQPGRVLGLLGRTGSGKTTLTRLLFRLYEAEAGAVRVGGVDVREMKLSALRRRIGIVTQEVRLFQTTVRDNVTLFDRSISDEEILHVLAELGMKEWLAQWPQGLDTELAPGGGGLSAGEAQLLAFARVFLSDPGLVILDEASSRLDPATERLIDRAVQKLLQGRTAILIAHRLATVQRADEILILEDGRIVEHGERETLLADKGSRFAQLQQGGLQEVLS